MVFFAFAGLAIAFRELRRNKSLTFYLLLVLAFAVPLFFSQSYMIGFYLPFQWFNYYMLPTLVVLAAITFTFLIECAYRALRNNRQNWQRWFLKISSAIIVVILATAMAMHFQTVSGKMDEVATFYSTSDTAAYQAGNWIRQNYADKAADVVVSKEPGHWFWVYSGLNVIAETDPVIDWNVNATNVLDFAQEIVNPQTMFRFYQTKTGITDETYVQTNMVWKRIAFTASDDAWFSYRDRSGFLHNYTLPSLNQTITMDERFYPKVISINYSGPDFVLTKYIFAYNNSYPLTVTWKLTALNDNVNYVIFYLTENFAEGVPFNKANVGGALQWQNPFDNPSKMEENSWALTTFDSENLNISNCIDVYDETDQIAYAIKFINLPDEGNIGALWNGNIDAIRWVYNMFKVDEDYTVSLSYQTLAFSLSSYPQLTDPKAMDTLFDLKTPEPFEVQCRDFASIISDNYISFIVYDKNRFDQKILSTGWVELVYSNDKYIVLKIKADHPYLTVYKDKT
jgi:fumarate reductase subunit C